MKAAGNAEAVVSSSSEIKKSVPWIYFVIFFAVLNESVFNVSTPNIAAQFGLDESGVSWVVTVFFVVFGMGMVVFGKLSDMYSVKKLITIGIVVYTLGSALGFALQNWYPGVIAARAVQGVGGSAIPALVFVMVARYFTPQERGKLFGVITSTVSFAVGIGPVLGGYVAGSLHWSYLFLVSVPVLIAIPSFRKLLPNEERRPGSLDVVGTALIGGFIALLMLATEVNLSFLWAALAVLALFAFHIRRAKHPFVEPSLFALAPYRNALLIGFLIFGSVFSIMFIIPLMLSNMYGLSTEAIGLVMFPGAFSAVIFGRVAGHLVVKRGSHFVVYAGLALIAVSLLLQSSFIGLWVWYIGFFLILMYIGFSFAQTALAESVTQILPPRQIGVGMGFFNMVSTISGAVVTAVVAKMIEVELFAFRLHPALSDAASFLYGNMILILSAIVVLSAIVYFASFRNRGVRLGNEPAH